MTLAITSSSESLTRSYAAAQLFYSSFATGGGSGQK